MADDKASGPSTRELGQLGERRAAAWLERHGLAIVDANVTLAGAEIDLIARDPAEPELGEPWTCVFVEVRGRADDRLGHPLETIDARKQSRVRRAATAWLIEHDLWERVAVRFDVVDVATRRVLTGRDRVDRQQAQAPASGP